MKKLILASLAITCAIGVYAQGTVNFGNRITGSLITHVYVGGTTQVAGNGTADTPQGTRDWTGYTLVNGSQYMAELLAGPLNATENSLAACSAVTTFRTGGAAGNIAAVQATIPGVAAGDPGAAFQMVAWDNSSGLYPTWALASAAWAQNKIAAGKSPMFTVNASIGGGTISPPNLTGLQSFNIFIPVPEPSTLALAGLGAAALLIFRRRK